MKITTGQGTISVVTLIAVWSISAIISLPGLAVTPILGDLSKIFKGVSEEEIQMLSSVPNLLIIPFVLLSGKIAESKGKLVILVIGLAIFFLCGILYFFAETMGVLMAISCLLGVGAGMIIPLSTGLIAEIFTGEYRTRQLGYSSSIQNLILVFATFITGWLANINWHMPFVVYLLPAVSLVLANFLRAPYLKNNHEVTNEVKADSSLEKTPYIEAGKQWNIKLLIGFMTIYFLSTYISLIISFNLSFVLEEYGMKSDISGIIIAITFGAIMVPGLFINKFISFFKNYFLFVSFALITIGLLFEVLFKNAFLITIGACAIGFGYGMTQPLMYAKTVLVARVKKSVTALAFLMVMNYIAIVLIPVGMNFFNDLFNNHTAIFPFVVNMFMSVIVTLVAFFSRHKFLFSSEM